MTATLWFLAGFGSGALVVAVAFAVLVAIDMGRYLDTPETAEDAWS